MPIEREAVRILTAAAMLEYDPSTIRRYIRQGDLEVTGTGRARRVTMRSIRAFLDGDRGIWRKEKKPSLPSVPPMAVVRSTPTKTAHSPSPPGSSPEPGPYVGV